MFFQSPKRPWPSGAPTRRRKNRPHDGARLAISAAAFPVQKMRQAARRKGLRCGLHRRSGCGCGRSRGGELSSFFGETAGYAPPTFRGALSVAPKNRKIHRDLQSIFANPMNSWRVLGRKCSETGMVTAPFCGESGPWRLKKLIAGVPTEETGSSRANERDRGKNRT